MADPALIQPETLVDFYRSIRSGILTSSLTVGAFLFTMKSFIVLNMKKEVYDQPGYVEKVLYRKNRGKKELHYGGLSRLKTLLFASIIVALLNALAQVTLGYWAKPWMIYFCLGFAIFSWVLVGISVVNVSGNLSDMLTYWEDVHAKKDNPDADKPKPS